MPVPGSVDPIHGLSTSAICTQTDEFIMRDGFRSFPSGHSSLSFAGLGFLSLYLAGKLHLFDRRGHTGKAWLSLTPLAGAALVAISRSMDYRHHWHDILVGSVLGLTLAYFSYRQYFPSLSSEVSHRPYSPRTKRDDKEDSGLLPTHSRHPSEVGQGYRDSIDHSSVELDGTVRRDVSVSLSRIWKDGNESRHEDRLAHARNGSSDTSTSYPLPPQV